MKWQKIIQTVIIIFYSCDGKPQHDFFEQFRKGIFFFSKSSRELKISSK